MKTINQPYFVNHEIDPGGEIGRHAGLKILWAAMSVRVQVPPEVQLRADSKESAFSLGGIVGIVSPFGTFY